jgi:hypothetical protein
MLRSEHSATLALARVRPSEARFRSLRPAWLGSPFLFFGRNSPCASLAFGDPVHRMSNVCEVGLGVRIRFPPAAMIVALARKLLIALWRFVTTGETLEGVILRPAG